ncbi:MAG: methyltransferase domain-containing protein [Thermoplasmata archaeon]|nr:methyltransferase domain-containing protein [Thermoplasmata archaeon]
MPHRRRRAKLEPGAATSPADRVRRRYAQLAGEGAAARLPRGFERLGRVLVVRLPEEMRPDFPVLGRLYQEEIGVTTVLRHAGPVEGEWRLPRREVIAGGATETTVVAHGCRWTFDAAQILFARGNTLERARIGAEVRPDEHVADLFAGIGYFTIPAARAHPTVQVVAVEANPVSFEYLRRNVRANHVVGQVTALAGDNRRVDLPRGTFDRVLLGLLPSSLPWVGRAVELLRPTGGILHVHLLRGTREAPAETTERVRRPLEGAGARGIALALRDVKPYGPGRVHSVIDARVRPPA